MLAWSNRDGQVYFYLTINSKFRFFFFISRTLVIKKYKSYKYMIKKSFYHVSFILTITYNLFQVEHTVSALFQNKNKTT